MNNIEQNNLLTQFIIYLYIMFSLARRCFLCSYSLYISHTALQSCTNLFYKFYSSTIPYYVVFQFSFFIPTCRLTILPSLAYVHISIFCFQSLSTYKIRAFAVGSNSPLRALTVKFSQECIKLIHAQSVVILWRPGYI